MRVFVTGASGFIGRWCCDLLAVEGHEVLGTDIRPKPARTCDWSFEFVDILDADDLRDVMRDNAPDAVLHLAARTDLDGTTLEDYAANLRGVSNLLKAVRATPTVKRAVYTSSQLVCKVGYFPKTDEDFHPTTVYGRSKVETERLVRAEDGGGVTWCLARPTTVWGPYMSDHYRSLLRYIESGRYFHAGHGRLLKSYAYAGNIAHEYMCLLLAPLKAVQGKVFYMVDYEPLSLRDYVNALADEMQVRRPVTLPLAVARGIAFGGDVMGRLGIRFPFNSFRLNNIRSEYVFDLSRTEAVCGPLPYTFEEGVRDTVAWHLAANSDSDISG